VYRFCNLPFIYPINSVSVKFLPWDKYYSRHSLLKNSCLHEDHIFVVDTDNC
jgi:hypothetical protein